ncbi:MAG: hypothetical protein ACD_47C00192G0002 [uncultured bacterium]|nr:MAG: hypothetical protein ACD_47C00192G0002 [uncultured bacterium]HBC76037.1 hypothetical protein [Candidatus Wallbacteria bacterium]
MSKKSSAILMLVVALIFSAYVSLAQACDEIVNEDGKCKCYLTVKVPMHKLTLGQKQKANDPVLFVKNETAKPVAIIFTKGTEVVREICVKPCAEETVIMDAGKFKYEITGCAKGLIKGTKSFAKGNNYNWVIDSKFAGYNTITKQIGECAPCAPVCKSACKCMKYKPVYKKEVVKPVCPPVCMCVKCKPVPAPAVSAPIEVKPEVCAPVCKPAKPQHKCFCGMCKPVMDCAKQSKKFFNHKPCMMNLAPVKPVEEAPAVEEKPVEVKVENAYIEMVNTTSECVTYLISGPGVSQKVDLKPCKSVTLEVLPGKYAVVASIKGVMSPMQTLSVAAGQKVEVKY